MSYDKHRRVCTASQGNNVTAAGRATRHSRADTFLTIVMTGIGPNANPRQVMDSATVQVAPKGVRGCFHYVAGSTVDTKTSGAIQMRLPDGVLSAGGVDLPQVGVGPSEARVIEFGLKGSTSTSSC